MLQELKWGKISSETKDSLKNKENDLYIGRVLQTETKKRGILKKNIKTVYLQKKKAKVSDNTIRYFIWILYRRKKLDKGKIILNQGKSIL